jgi:predicted Rossmann fold flavoprotein
LNSKPSPHKKNKTLVVIGGGAAGFFCAVNAARMNTNLQVILLEKTGKLLSKVKVSGGGRCNVTHALFDITEMSKRYPRGEKFIKKSLHQFSTTDTIKWFEQRGIQLKTEKDGRMFPVTDSSQIVIDCLMNEANFYGVDIRMNSEVRSMRYEKSEVRSQKSEDPEIKSTSEVRSLKDENAEVGSMRYEKDVVGSMKYEVDRFLITLANNKNLSADYVCIASGGAPKAGMFQWLVDLGHSIAEPIPSLFTFNLHAGKPGSAKHPIAELMGVSVEKARVKIEGTKLTEEGPVLITHWGLSGPAILRLSAWGARELDAVDYHFKVHINWLPAENANSLKIHFQKFRVSESNKKILNQNFGKLPNRLWQFLLEQSDIDSDIRFADLPSKKENILINNLVDYTAEVKGKTTFKEEFVTAGGIQLSEVDVNTMMSKKIKNLFFAGEVLDVDGITGGFNFQHAWTSGWIAAKTISQLASE